MPYAIDFGTSNTVIARWNAATQQPETVVLDRLSLQLGGNPPLVPSLLYVEDAAAGKTLAGQTVRDRGLDLSRDPRFFRNFKRGVGAEIQGFLPDLDGRSVSFEQVGEWFLAQVIGQLQHTDPDLETLVFTVPVDSFEAYRLWLARACESLNVQQVRMLDEPTAAALGYGLAGGSTLLVVDFGGGTLDLSLVRLEKSPSGAKPLGVLLKWGQKTLAESGQKSKTARVLAKQGKTWAGADIDNWLADHFATEQGLPVLR
ncbi:Hsp70 family protein [Leptolyngbya sp. O-77]|uniref:Hsp70 family protein n=1 Tax=Leptolyngbya sp. O-77 TaxID=1080068 RepID=UPI00074D2C7F|nr:Hsp70 family protein [Leptolyngbya sp. O-77]BAU41995.1 Chaperone protein DnaK [Leptolyngbya sp. O-77]